MDGAFITRAAEKCRVQAEINTVKKECHLHVKVKTSTTNPKPRVNHHSTCSGTFIYHATAGIPFSLDEAYAHPTCIVHVCTRWPVPWPE